MVLELQQVLNRVDDLSNPAVPVDLNRQAELVVLIEHVQKFHSANLYGSVGPAARASFCLVQRQREAA